jgi:hypothetical protein
MAIVYRAPRVVDAISEEAMEEGVIIVEHGRISSVKPAGELAPAEPIQAVYCIVAPTALTSGPVTQGGP